MGNLKDFYELILNLILRYFAKGQVIDRRLVALESVTKFGSLAAPARTEYGSIYEDFLVILDPGHGVLEEGKRSPDESVREYVFMRMLCSHIVNILQKKNINYIVTTPDYDWDTNTFNLVYPLDRNFLRERSRIAVALPDKKKLFISLHIDGYRSGWSSPRGMSVFRYPGTNDRVSRIVMSCLARASELKPRDSWLKEKNFSILRNTRKHMHSVLFEHGFMTNKKDVEILLKEETLPALAKGWYNAIRKIAFWYEQLGEY